MCLIMYIRREYSGGKMCLIMYIRLNARVSSCMYAFVHDRANKTRRPKENILDHNPLTQLLPLCVHCITKDKDVTQDCSAAGVTVFHSIHNF